MTIIHRSGQKWHADIDLPLFTSMALALIGGGFYCAFCATRHGVEKEIEFRDIELEKTITFNTRTC